MVSVSRILLLFAMLAPWDARARAPESPSEQSLVYWRYLCRGLVQSEKVAEGRRELTCDGQGWKVLGPESSGKVDEVRRAGE